jgi:signal transduction histidine kinase
VRVEVVEKGSLADLGRALEIDLFRVVQEFVGNAVRHGEATVVRVRIRGGPGSVGLLLRDNGKGFETATVQGRGMGLRNMHSRVTSHGGLFRLVSSPGNGTEARIRVDINN